jgi:hypothetical protein
MQTLSDVGSLRDALSGLTPGDPLAHGALTVVPLLCPGAADPGWSTLAEAGAAVTIAEVDERGSVPTLQVTNRGDRPVLLLDGEELVGAKQNRVLNTSVLVAARSTLTIPVSCVEQGRWGYRARHFAWSDVSLFASARRAKAARVTASLRAGIGHRADQVEVWEAVAAKAAASRVKSPTGAMHDLYEHLAPELEQARVALPAGVDQVGALIFLGDEWVGLEVLPCARLFASAWPRLSAGYVVEGVGRSPEGMRVPAPDQALRGVGGAPVERAAAVGLGVEYRLDGGEVVGAALVVEDRLAHLAAFPALDEA